MAENPRLTIQISNEATGDNSIKVPPPGRLTLGPDARRLLLSAMPFHDMLYCLAADACDDPADPDWGAIEDALTEILFPPRRWVLGVER